MTRHIQESFSDASILLAEEEHILRIPTEQQTWPDHSPYYGAEMSKFFENVKDGCVKKK